MARWGKEMTERLARVRLPRDVFDRLQPGDRITLCTRWSGRPKTERVVRSAPRDTGYFSVSAAHSWRDRSIGLCYGDVQTTTHAVARGGVVLWRRPFAVPPPVAPPAVQRPVGQTPAQDAFLGYPAFEVAI